MSFFPTVTAKEKIFSFICIMCILLTVFLNIFDTDCIDEDGHKFGKWEVVGRRVLLDNSAVHERTCIKCNYKDME